MPDRQLRRDEANPSGGELDQLNFDHHREERHRWMETSRENQERSSINDCTNGSGDDGWRDDGGSRSFSSGRDLVGQEYGDGYGKPRYGAREWSSRETWRAPGPFSGRGPRGYQRADDRIREELNDHLTAHGFIDATDIECSVHEGEVTLSGLVDSPETKRAAEYVAEGILGVHEVHNSLRIPSRQDADRAGAPNSARPFEPRSRMDGWSGDTDTRRSRARTK